MTNKKQIPEISVKYRLKTMVMARIMAESTVFLILLALPAVAYFQGYLKDVDPAWIVILCLLSAISAIFLPAYGFITWRVNVTDKGLVTRSLFQKKQCSWDKVKGISRRSNWNWQRYVVECEGGDLSFPIWLKDVEKLVTTIKSRLPKGASSRNPFRKFSQDPISLTFQFVQAFFGLSVTAVFWLFFSQLYSQHHTSQSDILFLLGFCLILSGCILWRTFVILLMPKQIQVTKAFLKIDTLFFSREYPWDEVKQIKASIPLLPEGFVIKTKGQSFLIDNGMDAADELIESVRSNIPQDKKSITDSTT